MKKISLSILAIFFVLILASTSVLAYSMSHSRIDKSYMNNHHNLGRMYYTMNSNNIGYNMYSSMSHYSHSMQNKINMGRLQ